MVDRIFWHDLHFQRLDLLVCIRRSQIPENTDNTTKLPTTSLHRLDCIQKCRRFWIVNNGFDFCRMLSKAQIKGLAIMFEFDLVKCWDASVGQWFEERVTHVSLLYNLNLLMNAITPKANTQPTVFPTTNWCRIGPRHSEREGKV